MWQELCKTREEYLERAKLDTKGYSPRRSETLLYEIARLDGMDIKKQDFFNILNDIEISPKVTREDTHRIKDLSNAFLYLVKCAQQRKRFSLDFIRDVSAKVMQHTGKEVYTTIGGYDTSLGDFRLGEEYYEEGILANYAQIPDMLEQLCKETNEKVGNVQDILTVKLAADFHYRFMHIKPFGAGTITVGLLMMNYIQMMFREPLILIPGEDKAKYLAAIKMQKDTPTPETFERFVGEELLSQLRKEVTPRK